LLLRRVTVDVVADVEDAVADAELPVLFEVAEVAGLVDDASFDGEGGETGGVSIGVELDEGGVSGEEAWFGGEGDGDVEVVSPGGVVG
jgi:hypothetical protein